MGFTAASLMQGGALVHVYMDGTVLVTHGGVELGQGIHTKCAMVCSHCGPAPRVCAKPPHSAACLRKGPATRPAPVLSGAIRSSAQSWSSKQADSPC